MSRVRPPLNRPGDRCLIEQTSRRGAAQTQKVTGTNLLLDELPSTARERLVRRGETVNLAFGTVLCEPDQPFEHVYFPASAFISLVARVGNHPPLEVGLIGNEGMLGVTLVLGVRAAPLRGLVQGEGEALRLSVRNLNEELLDSPSLSKTLNRYLYVLMSQVTQTTGCTRFHEIEPRLTRWLLMAHDRAHSDHLRLTHQFLADLLGVQRSAVTIAAGSLQERGFIRYTRGEITIVDRKGLEKASCECYAAMIEHQAKMFGDARARAAAPAPPQLPARFRAGRRAAESLR